MYCINTEAGRETEAAHDILNLDLLRAVIEVTSADGDICPKSSLLSAEQKF